jgi:hypothetical protein
MIALIYRCPAKAMNVQRWFANEAPAAGEADQYEAVTCPACGRVHLVSPTTGKVLGVQAASPVPRSGYRPL